jgi:hypothetical protein
MSSLLHRRIRRPSAALLVAFAALFTALGGTGYAALMITGANVANGSLTGVDIENKSLGGKEMKADTLKGTQIKESSLGTVPSADHAATADAATNATSAAKAADADTLDGIDSAALMTVKPRVFEANYETNDNFGDNATLGTLANLEGGQYLVTAKLVYDNDGAFEEEHCTLHVPGSDDTTTFQVGNSETETINLQEAVSVGSMWSASVSCTADPTDDMLGPLSIIAVRLD